MDRPMRKPMTGVTVAFLWTLMVGFDATRATAAYDPPATAPASAPAATVAQQVPEPRRISLNGQTPVELKVKRARTGHLLVSPQIDGQDAGWFIFDTGAGMSCVDADLVKRLNLPDAGEVTANGTGGTAITRFRRIKSLSLGPILIEDSSVVELNLKPIALAMGEPIDGVIGYEVFGAGIFEVDLDAGRITVHDPKTYELAEGQAWQRLSFVDRRPRVPGRIEGHEPGEFLLDLGANSSVTVHAGTVKELALLEGRETRNAKTGGVGGIHAARQGSLASLTICGQRVENVPAVFAQSEKGARNEAGAQGTIGVGLLKRFLLVLNYPQETVALLPRK